MTMQLLETFKQKRQEKKEEKKQQVKNVLDLMEKLREIDDFSADQAELLREAADRIDIGLALRELRRQQQEMMQQVKEHEKQMAKYAKTINGTVKVLACKLSEMDN